jgi:ATP-dependent DNA helicase RecQ
MDTLIDDAILQSVAKLCYPSIRPHQRDILTKMLSGQDCLFVAPTGSGKSLIFEAIPHCLSYIKQRKGEENISSLIIVVSPLISLMKLQAKDLRKRGTMAVYLQVGASIFSTLIEIQCSLYGGIELAIFPNMFMLFRYIFCNVYFF